MTRPLFTALLLAWMWRLALVTSLLWRIARLDLELVPPILTGRAWLLGRIAVRLKPFVLALSAVRGLAVGP